MLTIYIDADACPVKNEAFKVAERYHLLVYVVANQYLDVPLSPKIRMEVVSGGFDAADDWIAEKIGQGDILITSDLLLADRAVKSQARVITPKGRELDEDNIGASLAGRELSSHLRDLGATNTGPSAMTKADRSSFLSTMDRVIQSLLKQQRN